MTTDELYMQRCLQLAALGVGNVAPNPMVGAVIVVDNKIIAEGYHHKYGMPHAEPNAINAVADKSLFATATLYVNLEPCSHYGKTPPCADLIVRSGFKRVVIGTLDPNPKVSGSGVKIIEDAGIEVLVGVLEKECYELNKRFFIFQTEKRPFVLLKWAQTADGFIDRKRTSSDEAPLLISNEITRALTHKVRSENQSILVSTNTVILDNPSLTVRYWAGRNPVRLAIDRQGRIPENYRLFDGNYATIVFTQELKKSRENLEFVPIEFDENCLMSILNTLFKKNIHSVLVEGGAKLLQSFINKACWDEAQVEISVGRIGEGVAAPVLLQMPDVSEKIANHTINHYKNNHKSFV